MRVVLLKNVRSPIIVPEESVFMRQQAHYVFVVNPETNMVEERKIIPGVRRPGILEVLEGVTLGEQVIVRGVNRVRNGASVTVQEVWEKARLPKIDTSDNTSSASAPTTSNNPAAKPKE
jgi:membrane fusion protein (multidrug efflux system)